MQDGMFEGGGGVADCLLKIIINKLKRSVAPRSVKPLPVM